jgi:hypothetical protein
LSEDTPAHAASYARCPFDRLIAQHCLNASEAQSRRRWKNEAVEESRGCARGGRVEVDCQIKQRDADVPFAAAAEKISAIRYSVRNASRDARHSR